MMKCYPVMWGVFLDHDIRIPMKQRMVFRMIHFQRIPYFHGAKAKVDLDFLGMAKDLREQFL